MSTKSSTELSRLPTSQKRDLLKGKIPSSQPYRCKELNDTILQNATRVKAAIKLTQEDSQTIAILRREVDKAWKLVEQAKEKEEKARKII